MNTSLSFLEYSESRSHIARNGIHLIKMLMQIDEQISSGQRGAFDVAEIIASIRQHAAQENAIREQDSALFEGTRVEDWVQLGDTSEIFQDMIGNSYAFEFD